MASGERFQFGRNWQNFLNTVDEQAVAESIGRIKAMLSASSLQGKRFLDVGSGSGLSSLAAYRLGAEVRSFDFDPQSVECTKRLRSLFASNDEKWRIERASALDAEFLSSIGTYDVVYSWGVLHHTGAMWDALGNMVKLVAPGGLLYVAIYNDQGPWSKRWTSIKKIYNRLPGPFAAAFAVAVMGVRELRFAVGATLRLRLGIYLRSWFNSPRGMSKYYDLVDWVGGYPFEVAKPEEIFDFYAARGFSLRKLSTAGGGLACNEYVFQLVGDDSSRP